MSTAIAEKVTPPEIPDEPKVRRDGRCTVCKAERPEAAVKMEDPFCSTGCAKKFFGTDQ